jgi:3-dehydroquinate dehydratase/shikimate dehydrogenase
MRVASILCKNIETAKIQIDKALFYCDAIELRLDYLKKIDLSEITALRQTLTLPVIFTLRKKSQGGLCDLCDPERLAIVQALAKLQPDYFDLEFDTPTDFITSFKKKHPTIHIIGSYHDFKKTPDDLAQLFHSIDKPYFDTLKIATFANNLCDTLRLLIFIKDTSQHRPIIGMAMGEYGQSSRILAPVVGSTMTYGGVDETSLAAPGQLTLQEMTEVYRVHLLDHKTAIYALLGYPIEQSPGHLFHNKKFTEQAKNAVYVKLKLASEALAESISLFKQLPFAGFSVTIPHKETISIFLDGLQGDAALMKTVNTIQCQEGKYLGFNTDGVAAIDVLKNKIALKDKKILILGAGGSAKAIGHALTTNGAHITFCNRTLSRAQTLATQYQADAIDFDTLLGLEKLSYEVIINTLPDDAFVTQCTDWKIPHAIHTHCIAMDIVLKPLDTLFLERASSAGYVCIAGDALYKAQALEQWEIWFDGLRLSAV